MFAYSSIYVVLAIFGMGTIGMSIIESILPLYLNDIGVSPELIGLMFSASMISMAFGESYWGWMADKAGTWFPFCIGTFVAGLIVISFTFAESVPMFFLIFFAWGLCRSALFGPSRGIISVKSSTEKKATAMASITAIMAISASFGALPSGFIADSWGYTSVFFSGGGIAMMGGILVVVTIKQIRRSSPVTIGWEVSRKQKLEFRSIALQCLITALHSFSLGLIIAFLPLFATKVIGVSAAQATALLFLKGIVIVVLSIPMGVFADRTGKKISMIGGLLISAIAMAAIAQVTSYLWLIVAVMCSGLGSSLFGPAALGMVSSSVPQHLQSTAMGLYGGMGENIGLMLGYALAGFIWSSWGPQFTFLLGGGLSVIGAVVCFFFLKDISSTAQ